MKRYRYALLTLLLVPALWWVWPSPDRGERSPQDTAQNPSHPRRGGSSQPGADDAGDGKSQRLRQLRTETQRAGKLGSCPEVDEILTDTQISDDVAVSRLHALAMDGTRPTEHRLEALAHGMNLDVASFANLAEIEELPAEMADHFLGEIINYNSSPQTQIAAYIRLLDHPAPVISSVASEMLAFQVEDDAQELNREQLVERARQKLNALALERPPEG